VRQSSPLWITGIHHGLGASIQSGEDRRTPKPLARPASRAAHSTPHEDIDVTASAPKILLEVEQGIARITLNRPEVRNAIDDEMRLELIDAIDRVGRDPEARALVLTGAGRGFCAGGDISAMRERLQAPVGEVAGNGWRRQRRTHHALTVLHEIEKPTIAAINGAAVGLGCDLALCCDFIVAAETATLAMSYLQRGLIPDGGGLYFLPRRVGMMRAKELIFTGRTLSAAEALEIGMIDRVVAPDSLLEESRAWAAELSQGGATALGLAKSIINQTFELSAEEVFALGAQAQAICYTSAEHRASVEAFLNRTAERESGPANPA
jgi:enoyl-CoA hydratase/carnithine racemase